MSALNPFIRVLLALGFKAEASLHFTREVEGWCGRKETFILNSAGAKFEVVVVHSDAADVWYSKTIYEGSQTLSELAQALEMIEEDRTQAPKTKPVPEWAVYSPPPNADPIHPCVLFHHGNAVAELRPKGQVTTEELGQMLVNALTTAKK